MYSRCIVYHGKISGNRTIRTRMMGHGKVPVLSGCRLKRVVRKKRHGHLFYRYNDKSRHLYEETLFQS